MISIIWASKPEIAKHNRAWFRNFICLGAVHKRHPHKIVKNWPPPLAAKCPHWLNPSPHPYPCGLTVNFEKSEFFAPKVRTSASEDLPPLSEKCPNWTIPPPPFPADLFYGRPLIKNVLDKWSAFNLVSALEQQAHCFSLNMTRNILCEILKFFCSTFY